MGQDSLNIYTMITWKKFLEQMEGTPEVDEQQIDRLYDKSKIAVDLVRQYNPKLLFNITTIADLASGAYGIYSSGENKKLLPQPLEQQLVYYGKVGRHNLDLVPKITIQRYYPDVPADQIKQSDTIHVNIRRILQESQNDLEAILQIASTIVHEATHEIEFETSGKTSEAGPEAAERQFMNWAQSKMPEIVRKYAGLEGKVNWDVMKSYPHSLPLQQKGV